MFSLMNNYLIKLLVIFHLFLLKATAVDLQLIVKAPQTPRCSTLIN